MIVKLKSKKRASKKFNLGSGDGSEEFLDMPGADVVGDVETAYAIVPSVGQHGNLFHLLIMRIVGDRVVSVEKDVEDLRGIKLAKLHDHAMRDA
jgi:hypothetical protein